MLLTALLLAAAPPPMSSERLGRAPAIFYASKNEALVALKAQEACRTPGVDPVVDTGPATRADMKTLGDLPPPNHTLTVLRRIDGCPVSTTVRFNVDRPAGR